MGFSSWLICSIVLLLYFWNSTLAGISMEYITLLGDSYIQENGQICLTSSSSTSSSIGVGRVFYTHPVRLRSLSLNSTASFDTSFTFSITSDSSSLPPLFGDGLTFVVTSDPYTVGTGYGYIGLSNQTSQEEGTYVAVEFDTSFDPILGDISDNHIGIDMNSVISFTSVDSTSMGFNLKNGRRTTIWVEYEDPKKIMKVWLSYTNHKPISPILSTSCDISNFTMYLKEFMFVGFTASNGKGVAKHVIENWVFTTSLPFGSDTRIEVGCSLCDSSEGSVIIWIFVAVVSLAIYKRFTTNKVAPDAPSNPQADKGLKSNGADCNTTEAGRSIVIDQRRLNIEAAIEI